ncbi:hypothetical protein HDU84_002967 [Entophlyctis sp. JEL0112]|nr:hypothetical protein HDU84_002967 [Entophlyctis sp. JEL0112]
MTKAGPPFVPCSASVARAALALARVSCEDTVVDLGCGDARVLAAALSLPAPNTARRAIGVEIDPRLACLVRSVVAPAFPPDKLLLVEGDMFLLDLTAPPYDNASVLVLFLLPETLEKLKPQLASWLMYCNPPSAPCDRPVPSKRIVTIVFSIPEWRCDCAREVNRQWIFLYNRGDIAP